MFLLVLEASPLVFSPAFDGLLKALIGEAKAQLQLLLLLLPRFLPLLPPPELPTLLLPFATLPISLQAQ